MEHRVKGETELEPIKSNELFRGLLVMEEGGMKRIIMPDEIKCSACIQQTILLLLHTMKDNRIQMALHDQVKLFYNMFSLTITYCTQSYSFL